MNRWTYNLYVVCLSPKKNLLILGGDLDQGQDLGTPQRIHYNCNIIAALTSIPALSTSEMLTLLISAFCKDTFKNFNAMHGVGGLGGWEGQRRGAATGSEGKTEEPPAVRTCCSFST